MIVGARVRVELAGRLVGEEEARVVRQRARDRDALLLAAGQLVRAVVGALAEADEVEQLADARVARRGLGRRGAAGTSTFSAAVRIGMSPNDWKMKPTVSRRTSTSSVLAERRDLAPVDEDAARASGGRARRSG